MKGKIIFRADGNSRIGLGHITRCTALANMVDDFFESLFLTQSHSHLLPDTLKANYKVIQLPSTENYSVEAREIARLYIDRNSIVVLDGYQFQTEYQEIIKSSGCKLVCIDDLHSWHFVADVIINQGGNVTRAEYNCEPNTKLFLGPSYALLRKAFLKIARQVDIPRPFVTRGGVFICMGGADPYGITLQLVKFVYHLQWAKRIIIVTGSAFMHLGKLTSASQNAKQIEIFSDVSAQTMVELMQQCELAIVPASSIAYEVMSVGLPFIAILTAKNQEDQYRYLVEEGLALGLNINEIDVKLESLLETLRKENTDFLVKQQAVFNGKSSKKIQGVFVSLALEICKATQEDMETYFDWINEPETRKNSIQQQSISWSDHKEWFIKCINNPNIFLYLFTFKHYKIGQVRFHITDNRTTAVISYSIDPKFRGMGLGKEIITRAIKQLKLEMNISQVVGKIKETNLPSLTIFKKIGFKITEKNESLFELVKQL